MMKVEITARETIKPSSPTPQSLRNFNLSLLDQLTPHVYPSIIFFYSSSSVTGDSSTERSLQLKKSLSDTLSLFYPFAGRLKDNIMIDCSDFGAVYVEARVVDCALSRFLEEPDGNELKQLVPIEAESMEAVMGGFFTLVQANFFDCGGVAIGVSISHKLADATTLITFMRCWAAANMTVGSTHAGMLVPSYDAAALFPPKEFPGATTPAPLYFGEEKEKFPVKRFVFDASKIATLKAAATSASVERPSRAEAVTALIWKCALKATRSNSGFSKPSALCRVVNLRGRISPPLPSNSVGNIIYSYNTHKDNSEIELQGLVREIREKLQLFDKNFLKILQQDDGFVAAIEHYKEIATLMMSPDVEFYISTSVCNVPVYDIDFGWGKPVWVTFPNGSMKNVMVLMDTSSGDGSVEAWVILSKHDMYLFERDPELLAYASLNPSVK